MTNLKSEISKERKALRKAYTKGDVEAAFTAMAKAVTVDLRFEKGTFTACLEGREDPRKHFPMLTEACAMVVACAKQAQKG